MHVKEKDLMREKFEAEIAKAQQEMQEQTMQTIGADLHDNIGQLLSLTALTLKSIEPSESSKSDHKVASAIELISHSIQEMRLLGKILQGNQLIALGLDVAIKHEVKWMEKSGQYTICYVSAEELPAPNPDIDLILFRILQEILNNIIKHSKANLLTIILDHSDDQLLLSVIDNGIGFDINKLENDQRGMGLNNIKNRAVLINGQTTIESEPGKGTSISISIPLA